jgi:hypothetical protein
MNVLLVFRLPYFFANPVKPECNTWLQIFTMLLMSLLSSQFVLEAKRFKFDLECNLNCPVMIFSNPDDGMECKSVFDILTKAYLKPKIVIVESACVKSSDILIFLSYQFCSSFFASLD